MNNIDKYVVFIEKNGNRFYYKNGKLHREDGPAYVPSKFKEQYTGLADQELYHKIMILHFDKTQLNNVFQNEQTLEVSYLRPKEVKYYLKGINHSKKHFDKLSLAKSLNESLPEIANKKTRLKI